ncbi:unnamed protein product [Albugo candida]|uniref:Mediator complex subunit 15 KIX domain-containing protein n=1 Tax=Albugo candida TaxID=65357 RepID=A0A024G0C2_9STRA|nr:unnamed protein product [Albugo candida]|eukprot:CCI39988.1 unnamed protein product [Albugo candida]
MENDHTTPTNDQLIITESAETVYEWRKMIHQSIRGQLVRGIMYELYRISGKRNLKRLQQCATRVEMIIWRKSSTEAEYRERIERKVVSLRQQASMYTYTTKARALNVSHGMSQKKSHAYSYKTNVTSSSDDVLLSRTDLDSEASCTAHWDSEEQDEAYFQRLSKMREQYRDTVALVYRELCRVNSVIGNSMHFPNHEPSKLCDFILNLRKIKYLLEQRQDEMCGLIPVTKRNLEYLDAVESHIERKILPILQRLCHTYSTILRPLLGVRSHTRYRRRL